LSVQSWRNAGVGALAVMFLVTSTAHFTSRKYDLAGAIGLLVTRTRRLAGIFLVLLLIVVFPANVNAALNGIPFGGEAPTPLLLRAQMQFLFIGMLWWTSISARPEKAGRLRDEVTSRQAERETGARSPHAATAQESDRIEGVEQK
jgi:uncharacterized membrane protein